MNRRVRILAVPTGRADIEGAREGATSCPGSEPYINSNEPHDTGTVVGTLPDILFALGRMGPRNDLRTDTMYYSQHGMSVPGPERSTQPLNVPMTSHARSFRGYRSGVRALAYLLANGEDYRPGRLESGGTYSSAIARGKLTQGSPDSSEATSKSELVIASEVPRAPRSLGSCRSATSVTGTVDRKRLGR